MNEGSRMNEGTERVGNWDRPERRRCAHLHESGVRCHGSNAAGQKFCHRHQRFADTNPMYPARVPLLEDPDAIRLVISQTVGQLAVGSIPPANGRSMLYGCRMALDLLLYEAAVQKDRGRQREAAERAGAGLQALAGPQPLAMPAPAVVEECAAEAAETESADQREPGLEIEPEGEPGAGAESDAPPNVSVGPVAVPSFPDLRAQWRTAVERSERALERNLHPREGETAREWRLRQQGPIEAGHPQAGAGYAEAVQAGDPAAEVREGPLGADELPFDPAHPPMGHRGLMDGWRPEHIGAWYRLHVPNAGEAEVRAYVRTLYDLPRADRQAGWRFPEPGEDRNKPAPADCLFWTMSEAEIAAWLRAQVPAATEKEARNYAELRVWWMGEMRTAPERAVALAAEAVAG
jgi:hypothetical protein